MPDLQELKGSLGPDLLEAAKHGDLDKALLSSRRGDLDKDLLSSRRGIKVTLESPSTSFENDSSSLPTLGTSSHPLSFPDSVSSCVTTGTQEQYAEPWQTIIFLDFDDTLFPTTWLGDIGLLSNIHFLKAPTDPETMMELEKIDKAACSVLAAACQLSNRTCIVTNAQAGWVMNSAQIFMPQLHSLLNSPTAPGIVYARDTLQKQSRRSNRSVVEPVDRTTSMERTEAETLLTQAKTVAMQAEVKAFYSQYFQQSWKNLISIGDGSYERDAIHEITFVHAQPVHKKLRTKAIKLRADPTPSELESQLETLKMYLSTIVQFNDDLDVDFNGEGGEKGLVEALQLPITPSGNISPQKLQAMNSGLGQISEDKIMGL
eukprot:gnl/MRDRNA2_/MRDRNA2_81494_c0_seq2.p1 gnl/MRDRNA2_/MRDRNA2_81494_c0~~gnl/MRDRNA2_/MRDRNA2_81494_c0_seq2.p1  ORF type:complete len:374 (+),score=70.28 gnl/MRDRNA2_/MRDRNA2_81494_c0_seq2:94-1215(+)